MDLIVRIDYIKQGKKKKIEERVTSTESMSLTCKDILKAVSSSQVG